MSPRTPFVDEQSRAFAGRLGVGLFLSSLSVLFVATLIGFLVMRLKIGASGEGWPDLPPLPRVLWMSTLVMIASSATIHAAVRSIRHGRRFVVPWLVATLVLGGLFLILQSAAWLSWLAPAVQGWAELPERRFAVAAFYLLTVIHAVHVVGGIGPLALVTLRAAQGRYSAPRHSGMHNVAMYWHFLDAVWIVLFLSLLLAA